MHIKAITTSLLFFCACHALPCAAEQQARSHRIEVYGLSQNYWDTKYGDTLSEIAQHLLPNNPSKRELLMQDIIRINPGAFIGSNGSLLIAGKRLQLPGYMNKADTSANPETTTVENFSWGNIKRQKP